MKSGLIQGAAGAAKAEETAGTKDVWRSGNGTGEQAEEDYVTVKDSSQTVQGLTATLRTRFKS